MKNTISTHILDTSIGKPAGAVKVDLAQENEAGLMVAVATGSTNEDGRVAKWDGEFVLRKTNYRLTFHVAEYFERQGESGFYGDIQIQFVVRDEAQHYHVPLLLNPFGYSTYRGS